MELASVEGAFGSRVGLPVPAPSSKRGMGGGCGEIRTRRLALSSPAMPDSTAIPDLLKEVRGGCQDSFHELCDALYGELRVLASRHRRGWEGDFTLQTTALVHEVYLKLAGSSRQDWRDRAHFFAVASRAMRQILVNYAERRQSQKRGGGWTEVPLDEVNPVSPGAVHEILTLHQALKRLAEHSERQVQVVECRFFSGLELRETAEVLGVSVSTVERDWAVASAWLRAEMGQASKGNGLGSGIDE
jgi:RNA polymerase sigma factor (TIGR02999 family)